MLLRILKAWLRWRKDWDSLCNRCGKCCYSRSVGPDGNVIIYYNDPCENLDTRTNLCTIYEDRLRKCNHCGKVNLFTALFHPTLPKDCTYVQTFRLWENKRRNGTMGYEYSQLKNYMDQSKKTVAVTGAGISYLYGMRRLKQAVGMGNARRVFSSSYVRKNPEKFYDIMKDAFLDATFIKGPSTVHRQLAELEREGKIYGIVTQNMDCLHTVAGSKNVIEFQGSFGDNICIDCRNRSFDYQIWNQGHMPRCEKCGAPLMPTSFCTEAAIHDSVSQENMRKAISLIAEADLIIVIGTTGFRSGEYLSRRKPGSKLVQINPSETEFDRIADLNIRANAADVFNAIVNE